MLSFWSSQVSATVSRRAVANSPVALRFPKQIFLRCTPVRRGSFGTVVGGLDTFLFEKSEQPLIMALMFDIPRWDVQYHAVPG